jgi:D-aminoacyl-tRNA deacylase
MKATVQRVAKAAVSVEGQVVATIGPGLVCYLGVGKGDTEQDRDWLAKKIVRLRIFPDAAGKMNLSLVDQRLDLLVISQFTLFGDIRNGYRPSFTDAEQPDRAKAMYEAFMGDAVRYGAERVAGGVFGADMTIEQTNCGPVTILLDSKV